MSQINVMIIDNHCVATQGLCYFLETCPDINVVDIAFTADEGLAKIGDANPDVVVVDIHLPCIDETVLSPELCSYGLALIRETHRRLSETRILALTSLPTPIQVEAVIRAGACGYLDKGSTGREIVEAIRKIGRGEGLHSGIRMPLQSLTDRELEVYQLVLEGFSAREIASRLQISVHTVASHKKNINSKLDTVDYSQMAQFRVRDTYCGAIPSRKNHQKMVMSSRPLSRIMKAYQSFLRFVRKMRIMPSHAEPVQFNRMRFSDLLALIDGMGNLTRRETKLIWKLLLCFDVPDLSPVSGHSLAAEQGLQRLIEHTDLDYVTHGNPSLTSDLVEYIRGVRCQDFSAH